MPEKATDREKTVQAILDAAVDGVVLIDHLGAIKGFNRSAETMFGYAASEVLGRNVGVLMSDADAAQHDAHIARYLQTGVAHIIGRGREVRAQRKGGVTFPIFLSVGVLPSEATPQFLGFVRDLTPEREAQAQQQRLRERLILVSRLAMVGEIAAGIAHEVNQPLAAISNYASASARLLGGSEPDLPEVQGALREIGRQAVRAGDIIRRLRRLARGAEVRRERVNLNALVTEIAELARGDAARREVRVELDMSPDLPALDIDSAQIQQALLNLLWNALHALEGGTVRPKQVRISTRPAPEGQVEIAIYDNGPGIAAELARRLFEPFFSTKPDGTGLGLPISRTIAENHGGTLRFVPNAPAGACFVLRLPAG